MVNAPVDGEVRAIASGALATGDTVVVNSDGTVSVVGETNINQVVGSPVVFDSDGFAVTSGRGSEMSTFDSSNNKVIIVYTDEGNSSRGTAVVGTVSGTSISFGTPVVFYNNTSNEWSVTFDSSSNKVIVAGQGSGSSDAGAIVGTVSGTSISFGTFVFLGGGGGSSLSPVYDSSTNKTVIFYRNGSSGRGAAIVGTVSGTSISFGTSVDFELADTSLITSTFDSNSSKLVAVYQDEANSSYGTAVVGTVSGTSISFGTPTVFESDSISGTSVTFDSNLNKVVIAYLRGDFGRAIVGTVSGTSISFSTPIVFESADTRYIGMAYDSNAQKNVIAYSDEGNSDYGTGIVYQPLSVSTTLTAENYIGISDAAYSSGATATIQIAGAVDDAQSGLTAGQQYFVQVDGSLGLTAADPSVVAGTAVSATKLIVKG